MSTTKQSNSKTNTNTIQWMLWFEEIPQNGFAEALRRAAEYYHHKYDHWPNCVAAPDEWADEVATLLKRWKVDGKNGISVEIRPNVLPRHLMLTYNPVSNQQS